jgi:hypothetical protein
MRTREHNLQLLHSFANFVFPMMARQERWPIYLNHCFLRVIYDNVLQAKWDTILPGPASQNMTDDQIHQCVLLCEEIRRYPELLPILNEISLSYRKPSPVPR